LDEIEIGCGENIKIETEKVKNIYEYHSSLTLLQTYMLCCTGAGTVPGTGAGMGYDIFQKTKVRVC